MSTFTLRNSEASSRTCQAAKHLPLLIHLIHQHPLTMAGRRPAGLVARLAALAIPGAPAADHCPARSGQESPQ